MFFAFDRIISILKLEKRSVKKLGCLGKTIPCLAKNIPPTHSIKCLFRASEKLEFGLPPGKEDSPH
jgi:hypothetical protein